MELFKHTAHALHDMLQSKQISAVELANAIFTRTDAVEPKIRSYITETREQALVQAAAVDEKIARGEQIAPLAGIPGALKDNICTKGIKTTCASKILANFVPPYDATVVDKLAAQDAVLVGKTNCDEFAMGGSTENSGFFVTRNPWDTDRVPGGSSGGSASAVTAGQAIWALGSDTGGSIRQPAAYCGVVGMKPTYGLVSRFGLVAFASSLDQIGPVTKNVEDAAYVLQAIAGHDPYDSTSLNVDIPDYVSALTGDVKGLKIGVPKEYMDKGVDPKVKEAVLAALKVFEGLGAEWEEISLPHTEYAVAAYYLLASSEASSNLARYDGVRYGVRSGNADNLLEVYHKSRSEGFGPEVKRRIMLGTYALSSGYYDAYYLKAQKVRTLIKRDFDQAFEKYDIILGPTAPTPAFKIGSQVDDPLTMYLNDILTIPVNLAGIPAISIPCGFADGMPIGLQLIGKALDESTVLRAAHAYEQHTEFHKERPQL